MSELESVSAIARLQLNKTKGDSMYTLNELREEFTSLRNLSENGVQGVVRFDSGIDGPCVGITMQTHGNEPSGLAALRYFRTNNLVLKLRKGSVLFVLNNIKAAEQYFATMDITDATQREKQALATRFLEVNMNRLPEDILERVDDSRYEIVRTQELLPVWKMFDIGLDIHTTTSVIEPMIIALGDASEDLYHGFPVKIVIRNIERIQSGVPASGFYGKPPLTPVLGVEAGIHEDSGSCNIAVTLVVSMLQNLEMLEVKEAQESKMRREYNITGSIFFPNRSYQLVKEYTPFELIQAGDIIAEGDGEPIKAHSTCHAILPPPGKVPTAPLSDEVMFLSSPVHEVWS